MNVENIKLVRDRIAKADEAEFCMDNFFTEPYEIVADSLRGLVDHVTEKFDCGTACCIGGWMTVTAAEMGNMLEVFDFNGEINPAQIINAGAEFLGLGFGEVEDLFLANYSPDDIRKLHLTKEDALGVLDRLLETGTVDW